MKILGLNSYHGDSSACLVIDGKLIAAVAEERFKREKHWSGLPLESINYCLKEANISIDDVDYIAINRNPKANFLRKLIWTLIHQPSSRLIKNRAENLKKILTIKEDILSHFQSKNNSIKTFYIEHHLAHAASTFFVSPFEESAILTIDGFGDFVSTLLAYGKGNKIYPIKRIFFPHSLGLFYLTITQFLGFWNYGDEYKVMGLAAYGKPIYLDKFKKIVKLKKDGSGFQLDTSYFLHISKGATSTWFNQKPVIDRMFSDKFIKEFGKPREPNTEINQRDMDLAASLQALTEEIYFALLNYLYKVTKSQNICLAGGVALNSSANGKIFERTPFKEIFIQPAASDDGGAIGAAFYLWNHILNQKRSFIMEHAYWGPKYSEDEIELALKKSNLNYVKLKDEELLPKVAKDIADGKIVGWFQGRMEFGPRALGNRSIVVDPRRKEMKDILNERIKRREWFRPFAPSILEEEVDKWFEINYPEPFMIKTYKWKEEKRHLVPAVVHEDGTGRLQTVSKKTNPRYWQLIKEFQNLTGIPIVLNTSFNENEPIVNKPEEAIDCFLRTKMDVLVLENFYVSR
jgi:carbamoyltransferase